MEYETTKQPHPLGNWILVGETLVREGYAQYMEFFWGKKKPQDKQEGDGRDTKRPQEDSKGKWGHHEPVRERPADRDKDNWKVWRKDKKEES